MTITEGSRHATLGALWKDPKRRFAVPVFDPDGNAVSAGASVRRVAGKYRCSSYEIENPKPGKCTVTVTGAGITTTRFRTVGFEVNDGISATCRSCSRTFASGRTSRCGRDCARRSPFRARVTGWALTPSGRWVRLRFVEHTGATRDPNEPFTYTARIQDPRNPAAAMAAATVDREGPTRKEPIAGFNPKPPAVPRNQAAHLKRWKKAHKAKW